MARQPLVTREADRLAPFLVRRSEAATIKQIQYGSISTGKIQLVTPNGGTVYYDADAAGVGLLAATAAAVDNDMIMVPPGTYTCNPTVNHSISIIGLIPPSFMTDPTGGPVNITGQITIGTDAVVHFENLVLVHYVSDGDGIQGTLTCANFDGDATVAFLNCRVYGLINPLDPGGTAAFCTWNLYVSGDNSVFMAEEWNGGSSAADAIIPFGYTDGAGGYEFLTGYETRGCWSTVFLNPYLYPGLYLDLMYLGTVIASDVSIPPSAAELTALFGDVHAGFTADVVKTGGANAWKVTYDGGSWWYAEMTKAL